MKIKFFVLPLVIVFSVSFLGLANGEQKKSYDDLLAIYQAREKAYMARKELEHNLLSISEKKEPLELWLSLQDERLSDMQRAANGLLLIEKVFPEGDPTRWSDVKGFFMPKMVPRSLVALDGVFYTVIALLNLDKEPCSWFACFLMEELKNSKGAASLAMRNAPAEYEKITAKISERTGYAPVGGWPGGKIVGELPFAHPVRGYITPERAMFKDMVFLNASGVKTSSQGPYAWDRKRGKIYNVILLEEEELLPFWIKIQR